MRLSGYQPQYFPRLHYLARILSADVFAIADQVQFVRAHKYPEPGGGYHRDKSYQADTPIKTSRGIGLLTVPVKHEGFKPINQTPIAYDNRWPEKHIKGIASSYGSARNFSLLFPQIKSLVSQRYDHLAQLSIASIRLTLAWILGKDNPRWEDISPEYIDRLLAAPHPFRLRRMIAKSELNIILPPGADATDGIIASCCTLAANEYYHGGTAAAAYLDADQFKQAGIRLVQQQWVGQPYVQQFPQFGFLPNLSIIDLLMNEDRVTVQKILIG